MRLAPFLTLALLLAVGDAGAGASAQLVDPALVQAKLMCDMRVVSVCLSNPPSICGYAGGWEEPCQKIEAMWKASNPVPTGDNSADLDYVRGVLKLGEK